MDNAPDNPTTQAERPFVLLPEIRAPSEAAAWKLWDEINALAVLYGCEVTVGGVIAADAYDAEGGDE